MLFIQAWVLLFATDLGLRFLPYLTVQQFVERSYRRGCRVSETQSEIRRFESLVDIAARNHLSNTSCLRRALVLQTLLAGRGIRSNLRFGVRKPAGSIEAHAWLEYPGQVAAEIVGLENAFRPLGAPVVRP